MFASLGIGACLPLWPNAALEAIPCLAALQLLPAAGEFAFESASESCCDDDADNSPIDDTIALTFCRISPRCIAFVSHRFPFTLRAWAMLKFAQLASRVRRRARGRVVRGQLLGARALPLGHAPYHVRA